MKEYCDRDIFVANCDPNEVIIMTSSTYGRMRVGKCVPFDYLIGCYADVLDQSEARCSGRFNCSFVPDSEFFKVKPCRIDLVSYMEASYICQPVVSFVALETDEEQDASTIHSSSSSSIVHYGKNMIKNVKLINKSEKSSNNYYKELKFKNISNAFNNRKNVDSVNKSDKKYKGKRCIDNVTASDIRERSGYLSACLSMYTWHGTFRCPWIIRAQLGQTVQISMLDFYNGIRNKEKFRRSNIYNKNDVMLRKENSLQELNAANNKLPFKTIDFNNKLTTDIRKKCYSIAVFQDLMDKNAETNGNLPTNINQAFHLTSCWIEEQKSKKVIVYTSKSHVVSFYMQNDHDAPHYDKCSSLFYYES
ncbi:hypothetical protein HELRODRAFT_166765 [Helobdella robusta]|uniref:SUEL-type lectin domain-containing protein n=1 Tax=Helobdella robusta TaxID=6412 RepID=T1EYH7_HELRO|nr:hypothetical protein HELRODRAFT_166765 [Helobdella robusta]ESO11740.1 hypothetical protein HELRODRAFT_166765 [Helobdella robusta]